MKTAPNYLVCDMQFGSTGKGAIAYYLARSRKLRCAVAANMPNAGHTAVDGPDKFVHTVLPACSAAPSIETILLGPGTVFDPIKLVDEYKALIARRGLRSLVIHPGAVPLRPEDLQNEKHHVRIGSTMKGSAAANVRRMNRDGHTIIGDLENVQAGIRREMGAGFEKDDVLSFRKDRYFREIERDGKIVEGSQGFSLSVYHGLYPHVTSRDTTPNQIAADCALPGDWRIFTCVVGSMRTYPIRVANRFNSDGEQIGTSGPPYSDQQELQWSDIGREAELTTVTKLPRRLFSFSRTQTAEAKSMCKPDYVSLSFCDYCDDHELNERVSIIGSMGLRLKWRSFGPDYGDIREEHRV